MLSRPSSRSGSAELAIITGSAGLRSRPRPSRSHRPERRAVVGRGEVRPGSRPAAAGPNGTARRRQRSPPAPANPELAELSPSVVIVVSLVDHVAPGALPAVGLNHASSVIPSLKWSEGRIGQRSPRALDRSNSERSSRHSQKLTQLAFPDCPRRSRCPTCPSVAVPDPLVEAVRRHQPRRRR